MSASTRPKLALEKVLSDTMSDYASTADRTSAVDDLTDNGDTILLAAIRSGDTAEALKLINSVTAPDLPPDMDANEARFNNDFRVEFAPKHRGLSFTPQRPPSNSTGRREVVGSFSESLRLSCPTVYSLQPAFLAAVGAFLHRRTTS